MKNKIMIDKLQKFWKNRFKFDRKLDPRDQVELFDKLYKNFAEGVKDENMADVKRNLALLFQDVMKYLNTKDIQFTEMLTKELKLNL